MKIKIEGYMAGPMTQRFRVDTKECPFGQGVKVGSFACGRCEYRKTKSETHVYCARGDKRHSANDQAQRPEGYADAPCSVPAEVADEIKATWRAARDAGGETAAFRIIERMVDRLEYGRIENNPSLAPN